MLEELLELARAGEVVALAAAVQHYDSQAFVWTGYCWDTPLYAAGMVSLLEEELLEHQRRITDLV